MPFLSVPSLPGRHAQPEALAETLVIGLGNAEDVGHHQHGERLRVGLDELTVAGADELVDLAVGQPPHERLVLLEPLRASAAA